ncbi:DNA repair protein RecN [Fastidiosipila sanguinis]|uniref:DNA repair protein RecN n=1 Tax=Fastidiosipila sanguinis TaxID=236753 RepID=A0A2S0KMT8_9FIRM|nr:DNA repair protein RecN [Fastidiosipila sanguinis]AVM42352.1 DNA repair protein RecN [Fastidiosipila sanguinis]
MLSTLDIKHFALIESASLDLEPGFNCITGETGAGKSLLLGAIEAITGKQANRELIRKGADLATVDAVYTDVYDILSRDEEIESYLDKDEDQIILSREIRSNGKNLCRINGRPVTLSLLKSVGDKLADIHGQNDRQLIFDKDKHLELLDRFGHQEIYPAFENYQKAYKALQEVRRQEKILVADPEERKALLESLEYQINEIEEVNPQVGEDEVLREQRELLQNKEKIKDALLQGLIALEGVGETSGAITQMEELSSNLQDLSIWNSEYEGILIETNDLIDDIYNLKNKLQDDLEYIESQGNQLDEIIRRLDKISRLKRKYNFTIEAVWEFHDKAVDKRKELIEAADNVDKLQKKKEQVIKILYERATILSDLRKKWADKLQEGIEKELKDLGMSAARFKVDFKKFSLSDAKSYGLENAEFMIASNKGSDFKPLSKTASGGEASRVMLAIKVILAQADELQLLVFDEIDTGISGETSAIVAEKLKLLAKSHQILCVTHQAQIAAVADQQFFIYKASDDETTKTYIKPLNKEEREHEIARLLSGDSDDEQSLILARKLLYNA